MVATPTEPTLESLARIEIADIHALRELPDRTRVAEVMVVGTVLGDPIAAGLRRIARQHHST